MSDGVIGRATDLFIFLADICTLCTVSNHLMCISGYTYVNIKRKKEFPIPQNPEPSHFPRMEYCMFRIANM